MTKPAAIKLSDAALYAGCLSKSVRKETLPEYHDDGKQITVSLEEFVEGVQLYEEMLSGGHREYLVLTTDGEALAAVYPHDGSGSDDLKIGVSPGMQISRLFKAVCTNASLLLKRNEEVFGVLYPYVTAECAL